MNKPRIALVSFSPLQVGGVETHLLQIMEGMGSDFEFLALGDVQEPFARQTEERGAQWLRLRPSGKLDLRTIARLENAFRQNRIAIVHTHETRAGLLGRVAAKASGRVSLHTVHTPAFFLTRSRVARWAYQRVEKLLNEFASEAVVFVSPSIRDLYRQLGLVSPRKSWLIPNGLEKDWFEAEAGSRAPGCVQLLYVGRLAPEKNLPTLMRAFTRTVAAHPNARLRLVGDGPLREELGRMAGQEGLEGKVEFLGLLPREKARELMRGSDVFVLSSRFESMSYTLLEAMASGMACIATEVGGNGDLLAQGAAGILVPLGNEQALEAALRSVVASAPLRDQLGRAAREQASRYAVETMIASTRDLYLSLLAAHGLPRV